MQVRINDKKYGDLIRIFNKALFEEKKRYMKIKILGIIIILLIIVLVYFLIPLKYDEVKNNKNNDIYILETQMDTLIEIFNETTTGLSKLISSSMEIEKSIEWNAKKVFLKMCYNYNNQVYKVSYIGKGNSSDSYTWKIEKSEVIIDDVNKYLDFAKMLFVNALLNKSRLSEIEDVVITNVTFQEGNKTNFKAYIEYDFLPKEENYSLAGSLVLLENGWIRGSHFINIEQIDGVYKIISMGTSP